MVSSPLQPDAAFVISLVRDDPLFRLQRRLGLIPADGLGIARRALFWALLAWAPLALSAWVAQKLTGTNEALLAHYGVHVRLLVAVPLLVLAEASVHRVSHVILPQFIATGLIVEGARPAFRQVLADLSRLRDRATPWLIIVALVATGTLVADALRQPHELEWSGHGGWVLRFGAFWYRSIAQPLYVFLVCVWLWRLTLFVLLLRRIARMGLALVPTHPDKAGGLGFLERVPGAFAPVVLAMSAVLASRWAHDVVHHGLDVRTLWPQIVMFVVLVLGLFCLPLLVFAGPLTRAKRRALLDYGALTARHGRMVHDRWILGQHVDDPVLSAPELGPIVDIGAAYHAVAAMRAVPLGKASLVPLAVAAALPMVALVALQVPIVTVLKKLLAALA